MYLTNIFAPKSATSLYAFYFFYSSVFLFFIASLWIDLGFILPIHFSPLPSLESTDSVFILLVVPLEQCSPT